MQNDKWRKNTSVLELDENARLGDIHTAYRKLVMKYHPDLNHAHHATRRFREVVDAYRNLLDLAKEEKRVSTEDALRGVAKDPLIGRLSLDELEERLRYSSSPRVRAVAAIAIGMKGGEGWKKLLFDSLKDNHKDVCAAALMMLERNLQGKDILRLSSLLFSFKDVTIRKHAMKLIVQSAFKARKKGSVSS